MPPSANNYSNQNQSHVYQVQQQNYYNQIVNKQGQQVFKSEEIHSQAISQRSSRSENRQDNEIIQRQDDSYRSQQQKSINNIHSQYQHNSGKPPHPDQNVGQKMLVDPQFQGPSVNLNLNSGRSNTGYTQNSQQTHKSGRSQGGMQGHSHKKSKKKNSGRLPPPRVEIQQPNFNNRGSGENSNSQSDYQDDHSDNASKAVISGQPTSARLHSQNSGRGNNQSSMIQAQNPDSYRNESISMIYNNQQHQSVDSNQQMFNNAAQRPQQPQQVVIQNIQEESVDSQEDKDNDFMNQWGFAEPSMDQSKIEESPKDENPQVVRAINNPIDQSSISNISSIKGAPVNNYDVPQQQPYGVYHDQQQQIPHDIISNVPTQSNIVSDPYLQQNSVNEQPLLIDQLQQMDPISRLIAEKSQSDSNSNQDDSRERRNQRLKRKHRGGKETANHSNRKVNRQKQAGRNRGTHRSHNSQIQSRRSKYSRKSGSGSSSGSDGSESGSYTDSDGDSGTSDSGSLIFHDMADDQNKNEAGGDYQGNNDIKSGKMNYSELNSGIAGNPYTNYSGSRESHLLPIQFAKEHIIKIEQDMKKMHDRHVRLMREMDENYKLIEKETQEYYIEFLGKWKEVAKSKIQQYRKNTELLALEKDKMQKEKDSQIQQLNEWRTQYLKEKEIQLKDHSENISIRDDELEQQKIEFEQNIKKKDNEIYNLKTQKSEMEVKLTKIEVQYTSEVEQLKLQLQQLNKQHEIQLSSEEKNQEQINHLSFQLQNQIQELKSSKDTQMDLQKKLKLSGTANTDLQQQVENLQQQIIQLQTTNMAITNDSLVSMDNSAAQGQSMHQDQQQSQSDQITHQTYGSSQSSNLIQKVKLTNINKIRFPTADRQQNQGASAQQNILTQINQQSMGKQNNFKVKAIGQGGLKILKPGAINQSQLGKVRPQLLSAGPQMPPMSELEFATKKEDILNEYSFKMIELQDLISHQDLRIKSNLPNKDAKFDQKIKLKLQDDLFQQNKKMEEEVLKLKKSFDQSHSKSNKIQIKRIGDGGGSAQVEQRGSSSMSSNFKTAVSKNVSDQDHRSATTTETNNNMRLNLLNIKRKDNPYENQRAGSEFQIKNIKEQEAQQFNTAKNNDSVLVTDKNVNKQFASVNSAREPTSNIALIDNSSYAEELKEQLSKMTSENTQMKAKLQDLHLQLQNAAAQSYRGDSKSNEMVEQLLKQLEDLKKQHQLEKSELKEINKHAKSQLEKQKEQIRQLKEIITQNREQKARYKCKIESVEQANDKVKQQMDEIRQQTRHEGIQNTNQIKEMREQNERLWLKYQTETVQRKRLHNQIEDMKGKIRVYCRVRPMNQNEIRMGCIDAISIIDQFTLKIRVKKDQQLYKQSQSSQTQQSQYIEKEYMFDACFGSKTNQEEVFEDTKMLIQSAIDGFNVCIFAYGQTGSGKTYTVTGQPDNLGVLPRSFLEMFQIKERLEKDGDFTVKFECYMVELYLDKLNDLLTFGQKNAKHSSNLNQDKLDIREDPQTGMVYVQNAKVKTLSTFQEALDTFNIGMKSRKVHATEMNDQSSRSHLVYSIVIESTNNNTGVVSRGKISFVDLAGSERLNKSNPNANIERLRESTAINVSLKSLGDVIQSLSSGSVNKQHIPYRDNKLTHLMKDSLGGNSKTLMFVNISPADYNSQESQFSLQFGDRVKMIQNEVTKNVESDQLNKLKQENYQLQKKLLMIQQ